MDALLDAGLPRAQAALLSRLLPAEEWERLERVYDRYATISGVGRLQGRYSAGAGCVLLAD